MKKLKKLNKLHVIRLLVKDECNYIRTGFPLNVIFNNDGDEIGYCSDIVLGRMIGVNEVFLAKDNGYNQYYHLNRQFYKTKKP